MEERPALTSAPPLRWRPVVTFFQVTGDLMFATEVPGGHGHNYAGQLEQAAGNGGRRRIMSARTGSTVFLGRAD